MVSIRSRRHVQVSRVGGRLSRVGGRLISKAKYNVHPDPLYFALNILSIPDLIEQHRLQLMHSLEYKYCPASFVGEFTKNMESSLLILQ